MTTTPTLDVAATVRQAIALAEVGCEIVRVTAQNMEAARALAAIRRDFSAAGFAAVPLVADIHFLPAAALEAAQHVEKVRINPGNYADKKKFAVLEYSDALYEAELERLQEAFSPLVLKCRQLGRALRIGTNHGSLSDRILNRYGDTPRGMCESALEFLRIARSHGFHDIVISMKASNPKVMIHAYRLMASRMAAEGMDFPFHLGVTEAGDGDDARIKSAIGIGSLLQDGLGDTIRVSLTEDSVAEIPVAQALARKAEKLWADVDPDDSIPPSKRSSEQAVWFDSIDPCSFRRRTANPLTLGSRVTLSSSRPPAVLTRLAWPEPANRPALLKSLAAINGRPGEAKIEGLLIPMRTAADWPELERVARDLLAHCAFLAVAWPTFCRPDWPALAPTLPPGSMIAADFTGDRLTGWAPAAAWAARHGLVLAAALDPEEADRWPVIEQPGWVATLSENAAGAAHPVGKYRRLAEALRGRGWDVPLWIRSSRATALDPHPSFGDRLLEASILAGSLLADGLGDLLSIENEPDPWPATQLAYDILQGARARSVKTEFVACPSCGRTLFDLQSTTRQIRARTGHLRGVTIAVMGCIVNGPGEMADADFGYVGGAPGKVNLYVGRQCVRYHIPSEQAVDRLIELIRSEGRWVDPPVESASL